MTLDGVFLVDKPLRWSSFQVVRALKKRLGLKKVGHAGTLDPAAGGLLVVLVGNYTRRFADFQTMEKEYQAVVEFGKKTDTFDGAGKVVSEYQQPFCLIPADIEQALAGMRGVITQLPPAFSALKVNGTPAYKLACKGKTPQLKSRQVTVSVAELLKVDGTKVWLRFVVSSGTYIRSLAHQLGEELGFGAYLHSLTRTRIGTFPLSEAKTPECIAPADLKTFSPAA